MSLALGQGCFVLTLGQTKGTGSECTREVPVPFVWPRATRSASGNGDRHLARSHSVGLGKWGQAPGPEPLGRPREMGTGTWPGVTRSASEMGTVPWPGVTRSASENGDRHLARSHSVGLGKWGQAPGPESLGRPRKWGQAPGRLQPEPVPISEADRERNNPDPVPLGFARGKIGSESLIW
jgi:hypothetical protein